MLLLLVLVDLRDFLAPLIEAEIEVEEGLWWRGRGRWRESVHGELELFVPVGFWFWLCDCCLLPAVIRPECAERRR